MPREGAENDSVRAFRMRSKTGSQSSRNRIGPPQRCVKLRSSSPGCRWRMRRSSEQTCATDSAAAMSICSTSPLIRAARPVPRPRRWNCPGRRAPRDRENQPCKKACARARPDRRFCSSRERRGQAASVSFGCARPCMVRDFERNALVANSILRARIFPPAKRTSPPGSPQIHVLDAGIFDDDRAELFRRARQAFDHFSGIERAAGNFVHHAQRAGVVPLDIGEFARPLLARDFPRAGQARVRTLGERNVRTRARARREFCVSPARTSPKPGRSPAADSASTIPPVRPLAPAPMRPASSTTTDFSGASRRSHAAAARPVNPPPTMAKSAPFRERSAAAGVKSISQGGWPQRSI